ncbi:helix-turn-helix transcriptional regulator [Ruegeria sp. 2012CJ41-6]|uniref:Helix-turn-helix transcriptional regulator n=1 Tax=Ruegeria spongiae TaxID=2942209 RepID=A0ABT0Q8K0_9RHOB|nr:helix-turn-helix transcriptional regulator [Ruegeria spongiae]MCL6286199.1 helix-turn-helix transcriptional regulator [Ruegeria spongiae]
MWGEHGITGTDFEIAGVRHSFWDNGSFAPKPDQPHLSGPCCACSKKHLRETPSAYFRGLRLSQAKILVQKSGYRMGEIASLCGFDTTENFSRAFKKQLGLTATQVQTDFAFARAAPDAN